MAAPETEKDMPMPIDRETDAMRQIGRLLDGFDYPTSNRIASWAAERVRSRSYGVMEGIPIREAMTKAQYERQLAKEALAEQENGAVR